jgi:hypothetical protein
MKHSQMGRGCLALGAALVTAATVAGVAVAEPHATPSDTRVRVQDWTLVPILIADGNTVVVHSVLALRDKTDATTKRFRSRCSATAAHSGGRSTRS